MSIIGSKIEVEAFKKDTRFIGDPYPFSLNLEHKDQNEIFTIGVMIQSVKIGDVAYVRINPIDATYLLSFSPKYPHEDYVYVRGQTEKITFDPVVAIKTKLPFPDSIYSAYGESLPKK